MPTDRPTPAPTEASPLPVPLDPLYMPVPARLALPEPALRYGWGQLPSAHQQGVLPGMLQHLQVLCSVHDLQGRCLEVSSMCQGMLGFSQTELLGRNLGTLVHPADLADLETQLRIATLDGQPRVAEYRLSHRLGHWVWVESVLQVVSSQGEAPVLHLVTRNITHLRQEEEWLDRLHQLQHQLDWQRALLEVAEVCSSGMEPRAMLGRVVEALSPLVGSRWCGWTLQKRDGQRESWGLPREALCWLSTLQGGAQDPTVPLQQGLYLHGTETLLPVGLEQSPVVVLPLHWEEGTLLLVASRQPGAQGWGATEQRVLTRAAHLIENGLLQHGQLCRLTREALTDPLTGLLNRRAFEQDLQEQVSLSTRHGVPFGLLMVDLNGFKTVNDTQGHLQGDRLLQHFARALEHTCRQEDRVYRLSGDEFALLLPHTPEAGVARVVERAVQRVRDQGLAFEGASTGFAAFPRDAAAGESLLEVADLRMYRQKPARQS